MSRIGLDVDNVLADWLGGVHVLAALEHQVDIFSCMTKWWGDSPEIAAILEEYVHRSDVYPALVPVQGAVEGANYTASHGHEIYYITHRPRNTREITAEWLKRWNFPEGQLIYPADAKVVTVKRLGLACMVDDHPLTISQILDAGITAYLFKCYCITSRDPYLHLDYTVTNWEDLKHMLTCG